MSRSERPHTEPAVFVLDGVLHRIEEGGADIVAHDAQDAYMETFGQFHLHLAHAAGAGVLGSMPREEAFRHAVCLIHGVARLSEVVRPHWHHLVH